MTQDMNPQRETELSRQRGYGEEPRDGEMDPRESVPGVLRDELRFIGTPDRGVFRDDGEFPRDYPEDEQIARNRSVVPDGDDLDPSSWPETYRADTGAVSIAPAGDDPRPQGVAPTANELGNGYHLVNV